MPNASNVNFVANQVVPNLAIVKVGPGSTVNLKNTSAGSTHVIFDVVGYFPAATGGGYA